MTRVEFMHDSDLGWDDPPAKHQALLREMLKTPDAYGLLGLAYAQYAAALLVADGESPDDEYFAVIKAIDALRDRGLPLPDPTPEAIAALLAEAGVPWPLAA